MPGQWKRSTGNHHEKSFRNMRCSDDSCNLPFSNFDTRDKSGTGTLINSNRFRLVKFLRAAKIVVLSLKSINLNLNFDRLLRLLRLVFANYPWDSVNYYNSLRFFNNVKSEILLPDRSKDCWSVA